MFHVVYNYGTTVHVSGTMLHDLFLKGRKGLHS